MISDKSSYLSFTKPVRENLPSIQNVAASVKDLVYEPEADRVARAIVSTGAFHVDMKLAPEDWYTWSSGIKAPCYCDCRHLNCHPNERQYIADALVQSVNKSFPHAHIIIGIASAGIPWGIYVAMALGMPFAYVRSTQKLHGVGGLVECSPPRGKKAILIDDLVASGKSTRQALDALYQEADIEVVGIHSIINWGFAEMRQNLRGYLVRALTSFPDILMYALRSFYINEHDFLELLNFYQNPNIHVWSQSYMAASQ